jgi:hypothetical protein
MEACAAAGQSEEDGKAAWKERPKGERKEWEDFTEDEETSHIHWEVGWDLPPCYGCGSAECTDMCDGKEYHMEETGLMYPVSDTEEPEAPSCEKWYCSDHKLPDDHKCASRSARARARQDDESDGDY